MTKSRKTPGTATRALEALADAGIPHDVYTYEHSADARAFGEEAAEKLGGDPGRMFKTLLVKCEPEEYVVAVVPALGHLSMKLLAKAAGAKTAHMSDPNIAQRRTGYVVGGISPLGQTTPHRTFIDESCLDHETILVSAGKRGLSVGLSPLDLAELLDAEVTAIQA